jgi:hypothetical protein
MSVPRKSRSQLEPLTWVAQGGQGVVWSTPHIRVNHAPAVFKEYKPEWLPRLNVRALESMVAFLGSLPVADGMWIADRMAWPGAVVTDGGGRVCGFLMREVPAEYVHKVGTKGQQREKKLRGVEFLLNPEPYIQRIGLKFSDRQRVQLLADLVRTLSRMHSLGIVVGDLSPKNLLFSKGAQPTCFLIDCDAMRVRGVSALPQAETTSWHVPTGEEPATVPGDIYKFGLLAIRLFNREHESMDDLPLGAVSGELRGLAQRSRDPWPSRRPPLSEWTLPLQRALQRASATPPPAQSIPPGPKVFPPPRPKVLFPPSQPQPKPQPRPGVFLPPPPPVFPPRRTPPPAPVHTSGCLLLMALALAGIWGGVLGALFT